MKKKDIKLPLTIETLTITSHPVTGVVCPPLLKAHLTFKMEEKTYKITLPVIEVKDETM